MTITDGYNKLKKYTQAHYTYEVTAPHENVYEHRAGHIKRLRID